MDKQDTLKRIRRLGLVSVLRGPSPDLILKTVDALVEGGVLGIEITYTTPKAAELVRALDDKYAEGILLGMGTLTLPEQARSAKDAGARFIVSPHCEEELAQAMIATGLLVMIGALTPSEVVRARRLGADVVKLFPGSLGGPDYLRSLRGPYPDIPFMPTGGVGADNIAEWFAAGAIAVGAGSGLSPPAWAKEGRFSDITKQARTYAAAVENARPPQA